MSDHDLIRRGDALYAIAGWEIPSTAIAALPAVTVGVQEAVIHRAVLDWIKNDTGAAIKMTITPDQANAMTARILAALEPVAAPDPAAYNRGYEDCLYQRGQAPDPAAIREAALREAIEAYPRGIGAIVDLIEKRK